MARVQEVFGSVAGTSTPAIAFSSNAPVAGNSILFVWVSWATTTHTHTSVTDDQGGGAYTQIGSTVNIGSVSSWARLSVWQLTNVGTTSGTFTVTGTASQSVSSTMDLIEMNNAVLSGLLDQTTSATGASTTPSVALGSATTNATDYFLGAVTHLGGLLTITEDATNLPGLVHEEENGAAAQVLNVSERFLGVTGTYTANWVLGSSQTWGCIAVAVKEVSARPFLRSVGTAAALASGNVTPTLGTHATDDLLLVVVHSSDNVDSAPPGVWAPVPIAGTSGELLEANNTTAQRATVFWKRATSGAETNPLITHVSGSVIIAQAYAFGNILTGAAPFSNTRFSPNAASAAITFDQVEIAGAQDLAIATIHYEDDPTTCSKQAGWHTAGAPATTALGTDAMVHLQFHLSAVAETLTPSTVVSGGTFSNSVNVGCSFSVQRVAPPSAQDTPELYGRPMGLRGESHMQQVLAQ